MTTVTDWARVQTHPTWRTTAIEILDAVIGVLCIGLIMFMFGAILLMLH